MQCNQSVGRTTRQLVSQLRRLRVLTGSDELRALMQHLGFEERVRASHHVYRKAGVAEKVNLQRDGGNAKPYQVRQVRRLILKYKLGREG